MAFGNGPRIVSDGLVLALDAADRNSYPGSGTTWFDVSGNRYNGTLTNGPTFSNNSIVFDGVNDYVSFTNPTSFTGPYTILLWAKPNVALVSGGSGASIPNGVNRKTPLVGPGPVWNPGIWMTSDYLRSHADTQYVDSAINWTTTTWNMLGMTFDGTNVKNILGGIILPNAHTTAYSIGEPATLYLGAEVSGGDSQNWNGLIGPILIYNKVLTSTEILQNYNAQKSRFGL
jgi:hypothetical protein